jgi:hypothetical protein
MSRRSIMLEEPLSMAVQSIARFNHPRMAQDADALLGIDAI